MGALTTLKLHGLGNDFLVVLDAAAFDAAAAGDPAALVRALCDRHRGIGADGVIVACPAAVGDHAGPAPADGRLGPPAADVAMELRNSDGSPAETSGNGLRCFALALFDTVLAGATSAEIATAAGRCHVALRSRAGAGGAVIAVDMGVARVAAAALVAERALPGSVDEPWRAWRVDTGNPHLVLLAPSLDGVEIAEVGPTFEHARAGGQNLEIATLDPAPPDVAMVVWERGAGRTLACGSGSVAIAAALASGGIGAGSYRIHNPGGTLGVELTGGDPLAPRAVLVGPAQRVAEITLDSQALPLGHPPRIGRRRARGAMSVADTLIDRRFRETIVLVGVLVWPRTIEEVEAGLDELALLVDTAGADEAARVIQRRDAPDPATYIGRGKAEELRQLCESVDADTVVFDEDLTPAQQRNLERILGRTAIDRTAVILDIFAQNARTPEGRAQVELALSRYRLPRLRGRGLQLSQQAGGIGTRGPGETQLEVDRRRIMRRIRKLEVELRDLEATRRTQRRSRKRGALRTVSLVGYTNAGKSTLLNHLTGAGVLVENRLFSTLDPRTRRLELPGGETVLCSDTVGFVSKLPHQLVDAFHATLEVVGSSDLLVHVVNAAAPDPGLQIDAVRTTLREIEADDVPEVLAFNKADLDRRTAGRLASENPGSVACSALTGRGVPELLRTIAARLRVADRTVELAVPVERGDVVAAIHREGEVVNERYESGRVLVQARLDERGTRRFAEYVRSP